MTYPIKKLGELFTITSSKRVFKSEWKEKGIPFYRAREIVKLAKNGYVNNDLFIKDEMFEEYLNKYGIPEEGDIMVTGVGTLGICYVVKKDDKFYFKDGNIIWLKSKSDIEVNSRYIEYGFSSESVRKQVLNTTGTSVGTYTIIRAKNTTIPLPPLPTQKLIVQKLDSAFKNIDESINITKKNIENIKELNKSILEEIYTGSKFKQIELGNKDYLEIVDGDRGKQYPKKSEFTETGYCLFLNTSNVRKGFFKFEKLDFITEEKYNLLGKGKAYKNDIILTTRGTIGNTALVENDFPYEKIRINSGMVILRNNLDLFFPKYLIHFINSSNFNNQKNMLVSGSAQPQLPIGVMKQIKIPLPPLEKQKEIVSYLDEVFKKNTIIKEGYEKKLRDLEEMKQSILKEAFDGRLVKE